MAPAYIVPVVVYLVGTNVVAMFGDEYYPVGYSIVAFLTLVVLLYLQSGKNVLRPHFKVGWGIVAGVLGLFIWLFFSHLHLESYITPYLPGPLRPPPRVGYNPFEELSSGLGVWSFIAVRLLGIAVLVPLAEELFWRGFLLRWLIDPEWEKIKLGEFTWESLGIVVLMFALAHPEWFAAAAWCLLINGLLYWKKDLWQCVVAHAVTNLLLAIYVMQTGEWWLW